MNQGEEKVQNALLFITDLIGLIASYYIAGYLWLALWKNVSIPVYFSQTGWTFDSSCRTCAGDNDISYDNKRFG